MQKRLYKIDQGRKLDGVCGGIAEYFDIDPYSRKTCLDLIYCLCR